MNFPIEVNLDITQDDFIAVDILEQAADIPLAKKSAKNAYIVEVVIILVCIALTFLFKDSIAFEVVYFLLAFLAFFTVNFCFNYFKGIDREFNINVTNLLKNRDKGVIYTPEKGLAFFYEDRREYLTNEQRRYFTYDKILHIKETRHLFIFIMKRNKDKGLRGFVWMVLPKRNMNQQTEEDFRQLCNQIIKKYDLKPWTDFPLFD